MSALPSFDTLELEADGAWLTVWFNEPERRNPLTDGRAADITALCNWLDADKAMRGVTFRGRGGIFSAGGDLKAFRALSEGKLSLDEIEAMSRDAGAMFDRVRDLPQVTVMAIEGAAFAGAIGLACAGDVVITEKSAKFALTEVKMGIVPAQIAPFVIRRTGMAVGNRLMVTGSAFNGDQAHVYGIADIACDNSDSLEIEIKAIRNAVLQCAPGAVAATKRLIRKLEGKGRKAQINLAAEIFAPRIMSEEGAEGLAAFADKRKPKWARESGS